MSEDKPFHARYPATGSVGISLKELGGQKLGQSLGGLGTEVPQRVQGQSPGGGLGAKPPEAEKHDRNFMLRITLIGAYIPFLFLIYHYTCN